MVAASLAVPPLVAAGCGGANVVSDKQGCGAPGATGAGAAGV